MNRKIYFFVKIFEKDEHAEMFLDGALHSKKLSYFRKFNDETEANRGDKHEGVISWEKAEDLIVKINGITLKDMTGNLSIQMNYHDNINIFCLYAASSYAYTELTEENIQDVIEQLKISDKCLGLGKKAVVITDVVDFVNRVQDKAEQENLNFKADIIEYYDPKTFSGKFDESEAIFKKRIEFSHQKEYRFAFSTNKPSSEKDYMNLEIGSIRDIALKIEANKINQEIRIIKKNNKYSEI